MSLTKRNDTVLSDESRWADDAARRLAGLEVARVHVADTVLSLLTACVDPSSICEASTHPATNRQRLLHAAVRDLEEMDHQLDQARNLLSVGTPTNHDDQGPPTSL